MEHCHIWPSETGLGQVRFGLDRDDEWDVKMVVNAKELREASPVSCSVTRFPPTEAKT